MSDIIAVHNKAETYRFAVRDALTKLAVSISGFTQFRFMVKSDVDDADGAALISKTLGSGILIIDASTGLAELDIEATDTSTFSRDPKAYVGEFQGTDPNGKPRTLWQGRFVVVPNAIQAS